MPQTNFYASPIAWAKRVAGLFSFGQLLLAIVCVCIPALGHAQQTKNLDDVQIIFEKDKEIILPLADKPLTNRQQNIKQDTLTRDYKAVASDLIMPTHILDIKPRVLAYAGPEAKYTKQNYARLGLGSFLTTHAEAFYTNGTKNDYFAAKLLHFNSALGSEKWQSSGVNQLHVLGTYKAFKGRIKAELLVENNRNTLYGAIPVAADSRSDIRVANLRTGVEVGYSYSKSQKYDLGLALQVFGISSFNGQRNYFAAASPTFASHVRKGQVLTVKPTFAVNSLGGSKTTTSAFLDTKVAYAYTLNALTLTPSLKVLYETDSVDAKNFHVYPGLDMGYELQPNTHLFASVGSDYNQNLYYHQAKNNPWVDSIGQMSYLNKPFTAELGAKTAQGRLGLGVRGGVNRIKNYTVFAPSITDSARFYALNFKDTAVTLSYFVAEATYRQSDALSFESGLTLQGVASSFSSKVPNVPAVTWRFATSLTLKNWVFSPAFVLKSSYNVLTPRLGTANSGAVADLSCRVSYNLSNRLNLNVDVYNILNNKALLYYGYRQRGGFGVVGGTFKF